VTTHRARTPRADRPLPVKRSRTERHAETDRQERRPRDPERINAVIDVLLDHDERIAREAAEAQEREAEAAPA